MPRSCSRRPFPRPARAGAVLMAAGLLMAAGACGGGSGETDLAGPKGRLDGEKLYLASCAGCHGSDLRGTDKGPSHLSVVYEPSHHSDQAFILAAQRGVRAHHWNFGDMPAVEGLDLDQLEAIVAYIRSVQQREGFEPYPPPPGS